MTGVQGIAMDSEISYARECCAAAREGLMRGDVYSAACRANNDVGFGPIEASFLFCFVCAKAPRKVIQIGAGVSTAVILDAARESAYRPEVVCIDPYPTQYLQQLAASKEISLIQKRAQHVGLDTLTALGEGDLLFVDSTHTVKPGSEVNYLILECLPRLPAGAYVHFHDIYFPYDYPPSLLSTTFFPLESTLLHAFLINNHSYSVCVSLSMLHHYAPAELQKLFPNYRAAVIENGLYAGAQKDLHFPSSIYLKVNEPAVSSGLR